MIKLESRVAAGGQSGFGLLESLVSVALTTFVVLGLAAGLFTSVRSSASANAVQRIDSALASFSESLRSMPYPEPSGSVCPTVSGPDGYETAYAGYPDAWSDPDVTAEVTGIEHWNPVSGTFEATCPATDPSVHRLTIEVAIDGDSSTGQVVVAR